MPGAVIDGHSATITLPVNVWFSGSRSIVVELKTGGRTIGKITLDPQRRFPDNDLADNTWPAGTVQGPATAPTSPH
jgi:hypothetical protein